MGEKGEIVNISSNNSSGGEVLSLSGFKQFYYLLTLKRVTEIKLFDEPKKINRDDIISLNEQVQNKLDNHRLLTNQVTINVLLSGNKIYDFGIWQEFRERKWTTALHTKSVSIKWDFHVQLPRTKNPQPHTLKLRLGSRIRPSELMDVIILNDDDVEMAESMSLGVCKVDFVNAILATELIQVVSDWYDALPNADERNKLQKLIENHTSLFIDFVNLMINISIGLMMFFVFKYLYQVQYLTSTSIQDTRMVISLVLVIIVVFLTANFLSEGFTHYFVYHKVRKFKSFTMFNLTKGDENRNDSIKKTNASILRDLMIKVGGAVLGNLIMVLVHMFYNG